MSYKMGDVICLPIGAGPTNFKMVVKENQKGDEVTVFWIDDNKSYNEVTFNEKFIKEVGFRNIFE